MTESVYGLGLVDRAWLELLVAACERAADRIRHAGDPFLDTLIADIDELQARLVAELGRGDGTISPAEE
jgi:hypothetical protein